MKAYVLHGPRDLRLEDRTERTPGPGEVQIEVRRAGICGSDIHYYEHYRIGDFVPQAPLVLGHEFSGEVVQVGEGVTSLKAGDRVTAEPSIECGHCRYCREGRYNLCNNLRFIGTAATIPHIDGGFGERVVVPADHCYILETSLDWGAGALVEPLAVGMNAVRRVGSVAGAKVLITGGGTIGQMTSAAARAMGATDVTVADPAEFAQNYSLEHGAREVIDPREEGLADSLFRKGGFDIVFEASGAPAALAFAYRAAAKGARIVQIGTLPPSVDLPANLVMARELTVFGTFRYAHVYPTVLEMMRTGRVDVASMISAVYSYDEFQEAMDRAVSRDGVIKVQVSRD
jgi:L-idonate 5-dehydrogenase